MRLYYHTLVISDNMVTVMVTKSQDTWKNIEGSKRMTPYNM